MMKGVTVRNPAAVDVDIVIAALLSNSFFKAALKFSSGRWQRLLTIPAKLFSSGSAPMASASPLRADSIARSSCSVRSRSGIRTLHLGAQVLDRAELKLLHRAFAASEFRGNLSDALLLHKSHLNDAELGLRKPLNELEQHGAALDLVCSGRLRACQRIPRFAARTLVMIRDQPRRNSQQPSQERRASPLEFPDVRQRLPKHIRRKILSLVTIADAAGDIRVHAKEILFVKIAKPRGIALRCCNPHLLVGTRRHSLPSNFSR